MIKESLKAYLDNYFEMYKNSMGTYPTVPYEEEESSLWFGEMDEDEYIQWMYKVKETETNFSELEAELDLEFPDELKEFYNSYYFLELQGFYNGEHLYFDSISDTRDILNELYITKIKGKNYLYMGKYSCMDIELCMEIDTGRMVSADYEGDDVEIIIEVLTDSLEELLSKMSPVR